MNFYSTFYKKQANYEQIIEIQEKYDALDENGDKALNKDELANIFTNSDMTQAEKDQILQGIDKEKFMLGLDEDDDGFITYLEFAQAYTELDIDQSAGISTDEYDFAKKKISELEKQTQINDQYAILNDLSSTGAQKAKASDKIEVFKIERSIVYLELDVSRKGILVSAKDNQIQEIDQFIQDNPLLEFDEAKKIKEKEKLELEKELILMDKNVSDKKLSIEKIVLRIGKKEQAKKKETDPAIIQEINKDLAIYSQKKVKLESKLEISEIAIEEHNRQVKIEEKEKLLNKFFIPEFLKDEARDEISKLQDQQNLSSQRINMYNKLSALSQTRAELLQLNYDYEKNPTPANLALKQAKEAIRDNNVLKATLSAKKVELIDKQIQLKALMPKSDRPQFVQLRAELETAIAALHAEIADIEAQLP